MINECRLRIIRVYNSLQTQFEGNFLGLAIKKKFLNIYLCYKSQQQNVCGACKLLNHCVFYVPKKTKKIYKSIYVKYINTDIMYTCKKTGRQVSTQEKDHFTLLKTKRSKRCIKIDVLFLRRDLACRMSYTFTKKKN